MKDEINAGVTFLTRLIRERGHCKDEKILNRFRQNLFHILKRKYDNHWYDNRPSRGQAYRCIRINEHSPRDPAIMQAARQCGLKPDQLGLPTELTLWIDPKEVTCRFGENKAAHFCTIAKFHGEKTENYAHTLNIEQELERHEQLKEIETKKILYQHNRSALKTFHEEPSFSADPAPLMMDTPPPAMEPPPMPMEPPVVPTSWVPVSGPSWHTPPPFMPNQQPPFLYHGWPMVDPTMMMHHPPPPL